MIIASDNSNYSEIIQNVRRQTGKASFLYKFTILYFLLPCLVFLFGFTKWYVILLAGAPLVGAAFFDLRYESSVSEKFKLQSKSNYIFLAIFILAFLWTAIFGAGFIGPQTGDQVKNHMIFRDLFFFSWPVVYDSMPSEMYFLSYPLGYYLAPALMGKLFGWSVGAISIYFWTAIGIGLLWSWFSVFFSRFVWLAIAIFIFFSGLDILGLIAQGQSIPLAGTHIEWWAGWTFLQYSSNATVMSWSTQHGAAQWLLPTLMFYRFVCKKTVRGSTLLMSTAAFWSHLTLCGILIFIPLVVRSKTRLITAFKDTSLLALPFFFVVVLFYASKAPGSIDSGFIWDLWPIDWALPKLIWFCLFEFGVIGLFIYAVRDFSDSDEHWLFRSAIVMLSLIPIYSIGWSNDVSMRVSAIPLFILFIFFTSTVSQAWKIKFKPAISIAILYVCIASYTPINEMFRQVAQMLPQSFFTSEVTDVNWDRGINRIDKNCLITSIPRNFDLKIGDQVSVHGNGRLTIIKSWMNGPYQNLCVPTDVIIKQRPAGRLSLQFYREDKKLQENFRFQFKLKPDAINSITSMWPQQYTGSRQSLFYKYFLRSSSDAHVGIQKSVHLQD
jgi:hypothetical protein